MPLTGCWDEEDCWVKRLTVVSFSSMGRVPPGTPKREPGTGAVLAVEAALAIRFLSYGCCATEATPDRPAFFDAHVMTVDIPKTTKVMAIAKTSS
jgi:hypothetical protein